MRERVERSLQISVDALADTIARDTGLDRAEAELLSCGLAGLAEVSARWWLDVGRTDGRASTRTARSSCCPALAWRGHQRLPARLRQP